MDLQVRDKAVNTLDEVLLQVPDTLSRWDMMGRKIGLEHGIGW